METISLKEMEALLFVMDDTNAVVRVFEDYYVKEQIIASLTRLRPQIENHLFPQVTNDMDRAILKHVVENSDWPETYVRHHPKGVEEARATMRQLARRLEPYGIEVDRIAYG